MKDLYDIINALRGEWVISQQENMSYGNGDGVKLETPLYVDFGDIRLRVIDVKNVRGKIVLGTSEE